MTTTPPDAAAPKPSVTAPNCVTIFGGGIAGLSAAHELVERQFRVQVWECQADERYPDGGCDVGGMARTQWARVAWPDGRELGVQSRPPESWASRRTQSIVTLPQVFYIEPPSDAGATDYKVFAFGPDGSFNQANCTEAAREAFGILREEAKLVDTVYCEVQRRLVRDDSESALDPDQVQKAADYFEKLVTDFGGHASPVAEPAQPYRWQRRFTLEIPGRKNVKVFVVPLDGFPEGVPDHLTVRLSFRVRERWLPGEHGFRFFPAFYHHLFDTMKRTPILEPAPKSPIGAAQERSVTVNANSEKYIETGRTAYDNLQPTTKIALGMSRDGKPAVESRSAPASLEDIRQWLRLFLGASDPKRPPSVRRLAEVDWDRDDGGGFGCTIRDSMRLQLKVLKYLTSCESRRQEYEHMTWLDFLGGTDAYSQQFITMTNKWPEALIAMDARTVDARSHGSVLMQFIIDNMRPSGYRDGTLTGPTSEAWLKHWRAYLEAQGVEFIHGKLTGFRALAPPEGHPDQTVVWPQVDCYEPRYPMNEGGQPALMPGYFVLALPVKEAKEMVESYKSAHGNALDSECDLEKLAALQLPDIGEAKPDGCLRHMVGVQYYFDEDLSWFDGHIYFPESKWGVSGISQIRFWQDRPDWEHGYRGILSVIFSMTIDGKPNTDAWDSDEAQISQTIWGQIKASIPSAPEPRFWHIDSTFVRNKPDSGKSGYDNQSPYMINLPNQWTMRPGTLRPPETSGQTPCGYDVHEGVVLAGTYMKTYTRLTTMEAANESARHAVNGILSDSKRVTKTSYCDIWPLEEREVDDFQLLKDLDAELFRRGLDHFVDILDLDDLAAYALRGGGRDPFDSLGVLRGMGEMLRKFGGPILDALAGKAAASTASTGAKKDEQ